MKAPIQQALFGSGAKAKLIQWLFVDSPDHAPLGERALAKATGVPPGTVHKALMDLVESQLVVREETQYGPGYRAPVEDPRLKHLFLLLRQDSALVEALSKALKPFKQIAYACVFGSFARGATHRGSDVDVLVLEQPGLNRLALMGAVAKAADKSGREINADIYTPAEFAEMAAMKDAFALEVMAGARIDLRGTPPWQL